MAKMNTSLITNKIYKSLRLACLLLIQNTKHKGEKTGERNMKKAMSTIVAMVAVLVFFSACENPQKPADGNVACGGTGSLCDSGFECVNASCVAISSLECVENADCASDQLCQSNVCVASDQPPAGKCESFEDCNEGEHCEDNECVDPDAECKEDSGCDDGETCEDGECKVKDDGDGSSKNVIINSTKTELKKAVCGKDYDDSISAIGGSGSYTWTITGLPEGIKEVPTTAGKIELKGKIPDCVQDTFSVTAKVCDMKDQSNCSIEKTFSLKVAPAAITIDTLTGCTDFSAKDPQKVCQLSAKGGSGNGFLWSLQKQKVGVSLQDDGALTVVPATLGAGKHEVSVRACDIVFDSNCSSDKNITILVADTFTIQATVKSGSKTKQYDSASENSNVTSDGKEIDLLAYGVQQNNSTGFNWKVMKGYDKAELKLDSANSAKAVLTPLASYTMGQPIEKVVVQAAPASSAKDAVSITFNNLIFAFDPTGPLDIRVVGQEDSTIDEYSSKTNNNFFGDELKIPLTISNGGTAPYTWRVASYVKGNGKLNETQVKACLKDMSKKMSECQISNKTWAMAKAASNSKALTKVSGKFVYEKMAAKETSLGNKYEPNMEDGVQEAKLPAGELPEKIIVYVKDNKGREGTAVFDYTVKRRPLETSDTLKKVVVTPNNADKETGCSFWVTIYGTPPSDGACIKDGKYNDCVYAISKAFKLPTQTKTYEIPAGDKYWHVAEGDLPNNKDIPADLKKELKDVKLLKDISAVPLDRITRVLVGFHNYSPEIWGDDATFKNWLVMLVGDKWFSFSSIPTRNDNLGSTTNTKIYSWLTLTDKIITLFENTDQWGEWGTWKKFLEGLGKTVGLSVTAVLGLFGPEMTVLETIQIIESIAEWLGLTSSGIGHVGGYNLDKEQLSTHTYVDTDDGKPAGFYLLDKNDLTAIGLKSDHPKAWLPICTPAKKTIDSQLFCGEVVKETIGTINGDGTFHAPTPK